MLDEGTVDGVFGDGDAVRSRSVAVENAIFLAFEVVLIDCMINDSASLVSSTERSPSVNGSRYAAIHHKEIKMLLEKVLLNYFFLFRTKIKTELKKTFFLRRLELDRIPSSLSVFLKNF